MELSEACKTYPIAVAEGYEPKGEWKEIAGYKSYVTGSASSGKGIIDIYDIFGFSPQTIQGADILASSVDALVIIPDLLKGNFAQGTFFPPNTPEKKALAEAWRQTMPEFPSLVPDLWKVVKEASETYSSVKSWGSFGLCWGGKVTALASIEGTPFKASGQTHPGRLAAEDAEGIVIPHIVLASKDEDAEVVAKYKEILAAKDKANVVETYADMHHGWMGARAKLTEEHFKKEYERGYAQASGFFAKYL